MTAALKVYRVDGVCGSCNIAIAHRHAVSGDLVRVSACCIQCVDVWAKLYECVDEAENEWTYKVLDADTFLKEMKDRLGGADEFVELFTPLINASIKS